MPSHNCLLLTSIPYLVESVRQKLQLGSNLIASHAGHQEQDVAVHGHIGVWCKAVGTHTSLASV